MCIFVFMRLSLLCNNFWWYLVPFDCIGFDFMVEHILSLHLLSNFRYKINIWINFDVIMCMCVSMMAETLSLIYKTVCVALRTHIKYTTNDIALLFIYLVCFSFILLVFCTWLVKWAEVHGDKLTYTHTYTHATPKSLTWKLETANAFGYYLSIIVPCFLSILLSPSLFRPSFSVYLYLQIVEVITEAHGIHIK